MVGFIDLEINADTNSKYKRTVFDIINISFITEDLSIGFNSFIKPVNNNGKLFEEIINLTGITQEQVDNGVQFDEALSTLFERAFGVGKIYTWGDCDAFFMRKNSKLCSKNNRKMVYKLSNKFVDFSEKVKKSFDLKSSISLINTAYILGIDYDKHHNAEYDCRLLRDIYLALQSNKVNKSKLNEYKTMDLLREVNQKIVLDNNHFKLVDCKTDKVIVIETIV